MTSNLSMSYLTNVMPWMTNEYSQLESAVNGLAIQGDFQNRRWAQKWFENFQFILGNHYLKWSRQFDFAIDTDFLRTNVDAQKRSQTNISRIVLEALSSMIYSQLPDIHAEAKYDSSSRGARLAKTFESICECYNERLNLHEEFDIGSTMLVMFSKVFSKVSWNRAAGGTFQRKRQQMAKVPKFTTRKEADPVTGEPIVVPVPLMDPATNQPIMIDAWQDVLDESGKPMLERVRTGDVEVDFLTPFEIQYDPMAKTLAKAKWIQQVRVMDYDDFMTEFYDQPGAIKENLDRVRGGAISAPVRHMAIRHFLRTVFAIPPVLDFTGQLNLTSLFLLRNKVLVVEHYDRPSEGHARRPTPFLAEGRRTILANGRIAVVSTPQYRINNTIGWHPFAEAKWLPLAPSNQSSGPMSDTVQKNRELNLTDSLMSLGLQRFGGPTLLINENAGIDKNKWTGEPGQSFYVSGDPQAAVAFAADKQPVPALAGQYRQQVKDDVYEVSAAQDSLRGERNIGATSGYQARIYEDRERRRTSKAMRNWESLVKQTYMKIGACLQQNAVKMDDQVVSRIMRTTDGEVTQADIYAFLNGPLDFGVDLVIKPDSMATKSKATKIADMQEAMANPLIAQYVAQDPGMVDAYLDFMEIEVLRTNINSVHRDRAKKENAIFLDMIPYRDPAMLSQAFGEDLPIVLWQDDDQAHLLEHARDFVKNYERYKQNPAVYRMLLIHQAWHEQNFKAKQDEQSPYLASTAAQMEQRAEQQAQQPKNLMEEIKKITEQRLQKAAMMASAAPPHPAAGPAARDAKRDTAGESTEKGEKEAER